MFNGRVGGWRVLLAVAGAAHVVNVVADEQEIYTAALATIITRYMSYLGELVLHIVTINIVMAFDKQ